VIRLSRRSTLRGTFVGTSPSGHAVDSCIAQKRRVRRRRRCVTDGTSGEGIGTQVEFFESVNWLSEKVSVAIHANLVAPEGSMP